MFTRFKMKPTALLLAALFLMALFPMSVPWAHAEPNTIIVDFNDEWLPVGGVNPYQGYAMSAEEAAAIPVTVTATLSNPRLRALPAQAVPGGIRYGYDWLADPANTGSDSATLAAVYEALATYAEAAYASDAPYTYVNYIWQSGSINLRSLNIPFTSDGLKLILLAYSAFRDDNPQYYMINSGYSYSYYQTPAPGTFATFVPGLWGNYADPAVRQSCQALIEDKYQEYAALVSTVTSEYDIVRLVHDKMLAERAYSFINGRADENSYAHNILGVMDTSTNGPVCESFSLAFSYILHRLNVGDAVTVSGWASGTTGGGHAWNLVTIGGAYYYVDPTWDNRDSTNPARSDYDYGGQVNDLDYTYFLVGSGNPDFGAGNDSSAVHWAGFLPSRDGMFGNIDRPYYGLPNHISVNDYTTPSTYKYLTDNGYYGRDTATVADDYPYHIGKGAILYGTVIGSLEGNPLFVRRDTGYYWNRGPYHCGTYAPGTDPEVRLYNWAFDSSKQYINTMFSENGYIPLGRNVDYRVEVEPGEPGDTVRAWLYGIGPEYRGIDFVMVTLPPGVTLTGSVISYLPAAPATVRLMQGDKLIRETLTVTQSGSGHTNQPFTIPNVALGDYTLVITKPGHTSFTVQKITVGGNDLDLTQDPRPAVRMITMLCGDISGDNMINDGDLAVLWLAANYNKSADGPGINRLCDLNGDGMINDGDLAILWLAVNYNKGAVMVP